VPAAGHEHLDLLARAGGALEVAERLRLVELLTQIDQALAVGIARVRIDLRACVRSFCHATGSDLDGGPAVDAHRCRHVDLDGCRVHHLHVDRALHRHRLGCCLAGQQPDPRHPQNPLRSSHGRPPVARSASLRSSGGVRSLRTVFGGGAGVRTPVAVDFR